MEPRLLFTDTIVSGGDMTSHIVALDKLVHELLPQGKLVGWTQGNLGGYPLFQLYFPFPFLVMALLCAIFPFHVAFKLGAVLAAVLFPAAVAVSLRRLKFPAPVPAAGALLSLLVLCNDRQTVWGGNLQSLLAGEIGYSYGYLFFPLFLAELWRSVHAGRISPLAVVCEAAMGFSHGYALLYGGCASLFLMMAGPSIRNAIRIIASTHLLAFLLLGGWIIPLIAYLPYSTAFNHIWVLDKPDDLLPPIIVAVALLALFPLAASLATRIRGRRIDDRIFLFAGTSVLALLIYRVGYRLHVVDIRFLPFWFVGLLMLGASAFARAKEVERAAWVLPMALAAGLAFIVPGSTIAASQWANWNFSGLEAKASWETLADLRERLQGDLSRHRVYYEHGPDNGMLGTVRIFESLPYLAGRQTLEGIYIQSSILSPFVYYIQSELSQVTSAALPDYHYAHPDVDAGLAHLDLFNARTLLIRSDAMKRRLDRRSDVTRTAAVGGYSIYERTGGRKSFATPVKLEPLVYAGANPKMYAYRHFIAHPDGEPAVILPLGGVEPPQEWLRCGEDADSIPMRPYYAGMSGSQDSPPEVTCAMAEEKVTIRTTRPGWPVRLSMAWHPRWRIEGGTMYPCTPGFFMIVPEKNEVTLKFALTPVEWTGMAATCAAILFLISLQWRGATPPSTQGDSKLERRLVDFAIATSLSCLLTISSFRSGRLPQEHQWWGEDALKRYQPVDAVKEFSSVIEECDRKPAMESIRVKALRWRAIAATAAGDESRAMMDYVTLIGEFPESEWTIEAWQRVRDAALKSGNREAAAQIAEELKRLRANPGD